MISRKDSFKQLPLAGCIAAFAEKRPNITRKREPVAHYLKQLWSDERGQDIAEYAVMLAVILVIVVGTIRLIGSNANTVFSQVGSSLGS